VIYNRPRKRIISQVGTRDARAFHQFLDIRIQLWFHERRLPNVDFMRRLLVWLPPDLASQQAFGPPTFTFLGAQARSMV
jgi:hypothetical protein